MVSSFFTDILQTKQPVLKIIDSYIPDLCVLGKHKFTAVIVALLDVFFFFYQLHLLAETIKYVVFFSPYFIYEVLIFTTAPAHRRKKTTKSNVYNKA